MLALLNTLCIMRLISTLNKGITMSNYPDNFTGLPGEEYSAAQEEAIDQIRSIAACVKAAVAAFRKEMLEVPAYEGDVDDIDELCLMVGQAADESVIESVKTIAENNDIEWGNFYA